MEQKIKDFFTKKRDDIFAFLFFLYVIVLVLATISEIFDLNWFR
jgi:hypothetical protein